MIEVNSKFDSELTKSLLGFQMRKLWWLFIIFPAIFILLGVLVLIPPAGDIFDGIMLIAIGVLFLPLVFLLSSILQKHMNKTLKIMSDETLMYFRFDNEKIYQEIQRGEIFKSTTQSDYSMLYKAYETKSHFFLFISNMQTHIVPKKDITSGSVEQLMDILKAKLGKKKYKYYNIK